MLADPLTPIARRAAEVRRLRDRSRSLIAVTLERIDRDIAHRRAQLSVLGPAATLARGYAVVQSRPAPCCARSPTRRPGPTCASGVADGAVLAVSAGPEPAND